MVAEGTYPAAVASSHVAQAVMSHRPELTTAFALGERQPVCWAVRKNSPELRAALDRFVLKNHRVDENGRVVGSELYNVLYHKYFLDERQIVRRAEDPFHVVKTGVLSPYDDLIRETAQRHDLDWLLVASVCFQESRWDPERESWAGAVGLMQVMPASHGVSPDSLRIPAVNLEVGVSHLRDLFDAYSYLPEEQQVRFALAAYNAGQGHVDDARILSIIREEDPNSWKSVRESLLLLRKPEWHRQVRYGYVRGSETVGYVREVLRRYDLFHEVREQANEEAWRRRPAAALSSAAR